MSASTKHLRDARQAESDPTLGPAASPEAALEALRERGREMSEEERDAYIRQAIKMIDPAALADRMITRVPSLGGHATSATPRDAPHPRGSRRAAELLEDLILPDEARGDDEARDDEVHDPETGDDERSEPPPLTSATQGGG